MVYELVKSLVEMHVHNILPYRRMEIVRHIFPRLTPFLINVPEISINGALTHFTFAFVNISSELIIFLINNTRSGIYIKGEAADQLFSIFPFMKGGQVILAHYKYKFMKRIFFS